jgi:hypothetical protein
VSHDINSVLCFGYKIVMKFLYRGMDAIRSGLHNAYGHSSKSVAEATCLKMTAVYIFIPQTQNNNKDLEY